MKAWKAIKAWLSRLIKTDGGDWAMLLVSLLLAFSIWLIHNLSLKVPAEVTVRVEAHSNLEGHSQVSSNIVAITAQCYATGFNHMRARMGRKRVHKITFAAEDLLWEGGVVYSIGERDLSGYSKEIFGNNFRVESFDAESVVFEFPVTPSKKVPVVFMGDFGYKPQYTIVGDIVLEPDSVVVTGEPRILEKVTEVSTAQFYLDEVDANISGTVRLKPVADVRTPDIPVYYSATVTRYMEKTLSFRVESINVPADKEMVVIPSEVKVCFKLPFQSNLELESLASFHVDYDDFIRSYSGRCMVQTDREMPEVIEWRAEPEMVECFVRSR